MAYLTPQAGPAWFSLQRGLRCFGTEPFWTLFLDSNSQSARFLTPEGEGPQMTIATLWPGADWHPVAGLRATGPDSEAIAVIRAAACSDGMSDAGFGLAVDVFSSGSAAAPASSLQGCCTLAP